MYSKALGPLLCGILLFQGVIGAVLPRDDAGSGEDSGKDSGEDSGNDGSGDNAGKYQWVPHDQVVAFPQSPSSTVGELELRFNPWLYNGGGCDPYPGVQADGGLSAGLKPTGGRASGCDNGKTAQVYSRVGKSGDGNRMGIMYSYYMPKVRWGKGAKNGQRHYWASAIVWTDRKSCDTTDATAVMPVGVSYTVDHLTWEAAPNSDISFKSQTEGILQPVQPKLTIHDEKFSPFTGADGPLLFQRTLASWDSLPEKARDSLSHVKYEHTEVPFAPNNFQSHMDAAFKSGFYAGLPPATDCIVQPSPDQGTPDPGVPGDDIPSGPGDDDDGPSGDPADDDDYPTDDSGSDIPDPDMSDPDTPPNDTDDDIPPPKEPKPANRDDPGSDNPDADI
ncbi:hypothetical protein LY78DRAFT_698067 [Colletotrichum sublineola]|nr:hypothetical protein LY78DRAFT_698067 [Colletotrichum sublineola]